MTAPFLMTSRYVDERGIPLQGRVWSKSETAQQRHSSWSRVCEVTVQYQPPDWGTVGFLKTEVEPAAFDALHKGQTVALRYLPQTELPRVPMAETLGRMRILPVTRMADRTMWTPVQSTLATGEGRILKWIGAGVLLLIVWRFAGWPRFAWAVATVIVLAIGAMLVDEFPQPTPKPAANVRQAPGRVASVQTITRLFDSTRSRGMWANQPVDVVGVEFVPEGRTEPVLAIDLIDADMRPPHRVGAAVVIDYEADAPRTAWVRGATRDFVSRNLSGMIMEGVLVLALLAAVLAGVEFLGRAWKRLLARR